MSSNDDAPGTPVVWDTGKPMYQEFVQVSDSQDLPRNPGATPTPAPAQSGSAATYYANGQTRPVIQMDIEPARPYGYGEAAPADTSSDASVATRHGWDCFYDRVQSAWYYVHAANPTVTTWVNPYAHLQAPAVGNDDYVNGVAAALASTSGTRTLARIGGMSADEMRYRQDWENDVSADVPSGSGAAGAEEQVDEPRRHKKSSKSSKGKKRSK
ncbi:hypothetical protein EYC80_003227 [Monilinia laxa]|uniref:Uncharacterized protein n=1 Tax=Monilinia laxa TaxID=61186 RepID=A0A5N6KD62_MONLA|nr:hypothetical protein EYC80_003227 [Monilinia laxa]